MAFRVAAQQSPTLGWLSPDCAWWEEWLVRSHLVGRSGCPSGLSCEAFGEGLETREPYELGVSVCKDCRVSGDGKERDMQVDLLEGAKMWIWNQ